MRVPDSVTPRRDRIGISRSKGKPIFARQRLFIRFFRRGAGACLRIIFFLSIIRRLPVTASAPTCTYYTATARRRSGVCIFFRRRRYFRPVFGLIYNSNNDQKVPQSHDHNNGPRAFRTNRCSSSLPPSPGHCFSRTSVTARVYVCSL
jgi:hypothetical protein